MKEKKSKEGAMTIFQHLSEMRKRVIRIFIAFLIGFLLSYAFREFLLDVLQHPLQKPLAQYSQIHKENTQSDQTSQKKVTLQGLSCQCQKNDTLDIIGTHTGKKLNFTHQCYCNVEKGELANNVQENTGNLVFLNLPEVFFSYLKLAFLLGIFLSFPYIIIEIWMFLAPALYKDEKKFFWWFIPFTYICFLGGAIFGYFVVFPYGFEFFLSLSQPNEILPSLSVGQYVGFALKLLFAFGIVFELPLIILILSRLGIVTPKFLIANTKYAVVAAFIFGAILTPPDPFTMMLMAIPLIMLYTLSIVLCYITYSRKKAKLRKQGFE